MNAKIDWEAFNTLERAAKTRIMRGESNTLSDDEIEAINASLRMTLAHLEPAVDLLAAAKKRYAGKP